jgi:RNA polymerase sigma factor (sigma-70 family)
VVQTDEMRRLAQALSALAPKQRELLIRAFYDEVPLVKIAQEEKVSQSAISQRIKVLRKKFKKLFE